MVLTNKMIMFIKLFVFRPIKGHFNVLYETEICYWICVLTNSPARQVSSAVSLQHDGRLENFSVSNSLQPTTHRLLDLNTGGTELICPQLLQVRHLPGSKEDLCLPELEHVGFLTHER